MSEQAADYFKKLTDAGVVDATDMTPGLEEILGKLTPSEVDSVISAHKKAQTVPGGAVLFQIAAKASGGGGA